MRSGPATDTPVFVRRRLAAASIGFGAFCALGFAGSSEPWSEQQVWFVVGLGIALSFTFVEPYFATPGATVVNALGALGASLSVSTDPVGGLWFTFQAFSALVLVAGIAGSLTRDGRLNAVASQFATRFGRAASLGAGLLLLIVLTQAAAGTDGFEYLALGTGALILAISFDWTVLWRRVIGKADGAVAVGAVGPRMLLVAGGSRRFKQGDSVTVSGAIGRASPGTIVARMSHGEGLRHQVALSKEWTSVCRRFPATVTLTAGDADGTLAGAVIDGTTERAIEFEPFRALSIGEPLLMQDRTRTLLYQVASMKLATANWSGATAIVPRATAHLVGVPEENHLRAVSHLPAPHELVYSAEMASDLDEGYFEIGHIKGNSDSDRASSGQRTAWTYRRAWNVGYGQDSCCSEDFFDARTGPRRRRLRHDGRVSREARLPGVERWRYVNHWASRLRASGRSAG